MQRLLAATFWAVSFGVAWISQAAAQWPPLGAVADPANPSLAVRTTLSPGATATVGGQTAVSPPGHYTLVDRYYYDCAKKAWIWVGREWKENGVIVTPPGQTKSPDYKQPLPSGPPPGAEWSPGHTTSAFNPTTGQNFAREGDNWIDVKTGKVIVAPKLCPEPATAVAPQPQVGMVAPGMTSSPKLIPAPPGQAQQNLNQPDCATDPASGQNLKWDPVRNSWVNTTTAQAVGFQGLVARDGTPIPAPPVIPGRTGGKHQAQQDSANPESAHDAVTGQDLKWDRDRNTWIDTKTGNAVGFQGASVSSATPVGLPTCYAMNAPAPTGSGFGFGFGFGSGGQGDEGDRVQPERRSVPKKP